MFYPPFWFWPDKPTLLGAPANITYGKNFAAQYDAVYNVVSEVLHHPCHACTRFVLSMGTYIQTRACTKGSQARAASQCVRVVRATPCVVEHGSQTLRYNSLAWLQPRPTLFLPWTNPHIPAAPRACHHIPSLDRLAAAAVCRAGAHFRRGAGCP